MSNIAPALIPYSFLDGIRIFHRGCVYLGVGGSYLARDRFQSAILTAMSALVGTDIARQPWHSLVAREETHADCFLGGTRFISSQ